MRGRSCSTPPLSSRTIPISSRRFKWYLSSRVGPSLWSAPAASEWLRRWRPSQLISDMFGRPCFGPRSFPRTSRVPRSPSPSAGEEKGCPPRATTSSRSGGSGCAWPSSCGSEPGGTAGRDAEAAVHALTQALGPLANLGEDMRGGSGSRPAGPRAASVPPATHRPEHPPRGGHPPLRRPSPSCGV